MATTAIDSRDRAFERLYSRYARDVYRFALAVVRNPSEAEDVTQTTFMNAYRAIKRGDRPERPRSWLIAIAHNAIRSRRRWTLRRPKEVPLEAAVHHLAVPVDERAGVAEVLRALGDLPIHQREALAMRELEGRSYPEIAATLGVSVPAVESLIARARRTLRAQRASLRGLTVVQLPRSLRALRSLVERADPVSGGLAPKVAVLAAAGTLVAGGAGVGQHDAGASQPAPAARHALPQRLELAGRTAPAIAAAVEPVVPLRTVTGRPHAAARAVHRAATTRRQPDLQAPADASGPQAGAASPPAASAAPAGAPTLPVHAAAPAAGRTRIVPQLPEASTAAATVVTPALPAVPAVSAPVGPIPPDSVPAAASAAVSSAAVSTPVVSIPAVSSPAVSSPAVPSPPVSSSAVSGPGASSVGPPPPKTSHVSEIADLG